MRKVFDKIYAWWYCEARYYHKDFLIGVKNLIRWFRVIWKDRDWDDHFIWNIMIQKLEFQANYIETKDRHTRAKRDAEVMRLCQELMKRVRDEYYGCEYMDFHDTKYEFVDCDMPGHKELKTTEISEKFDEYFHKYPLVYRKVIRDNPDESKSRIAFLISLENHKRAKRLLFRLMEQHIECWWD